MYNSTPPVDRRTKPCTHSKFRAKMEFEFLGLFPHQVRDMVLSWWDLTAFSFLDTDFADSYFAQGYEGQVTQILALALPGRF